MTIPKIILPDPKKLPRHPWNRGLVRSLLKLGDFNLADVNMGKLPHIGRISDEIGLPRSHTGTIIQVNDKYVYLDTWDFGIPSIIILMHLDKIPIKLSAVIKIQKGIKPFPNEEIPVLPWSMFSSKHTLWLENQPKYREAYLSSKKEYKIAYTGRNFHFRRIWIEEIKRLGGFTFVWPRIPKDSRDDYVTKMCQWESSLILKGKTDSRTDGKNRREVECASIGMPMIMNYKPHYLNELVPGKHYIYVKTHSEIEKALETLTPDFAAELGNNAYEWWKANASDEGLCRTFIQVLETANVI